jgi:hypothetical protein
VQGTESLLPVASDPSGSTIALGRPGFQGASCPLQRAGYRGDRRVQHVRCLGRRVAEHLAQDQHRPLTGGEESLGPFRRQLNGLALLVVGVRAEARVPNLDRLVPPVVWVRGRAVVDRNQGIQGNARRPMIPTMRRAVGGMRCAWPARRLLEGPGTTSNIALHHEAIAIDAAAQRSETSHTAGHVLLVIDVEG